MVGLVYPDTGVSTNRIKARDYVEGMWRVMHQWVCLVSRFTRFTDPSSVEADDFVLARCASLITRYAGNCSRSTDTELSNETHSVREFIERSFAVVNLHIRWQGSGVHEVGICKETGQVLVR